MMKSMNKAEFYAATGCVPEQDELERANCPHAGQFGHQGCGICEHDLPVFMCKKCFSLGVTTSPFGTQTGCMYSDQPFHKEAERLAAKPAQESSPVTNEAFEDFARRSYTHEKAARFDLSRWLPPREIEERIVTLRALDASNHRARRVIVGILGAVIGFILGYFTWAVWPVSGLVYRLFNECFLGG